MPATAVGTACFDLHGVTLAVRGADAALLDAVRSRLRAFLTGGPACRADLRFDYRYVAQPEEHRHLLPPPGATPFYEPRSGKACYDPERDEVFLVCGDWLRVRAQPGTGQVDVSVLESARHRRWFLSHPVVTLPLLELLKRRARYPVHAASMSLNGRGVLVAGTSGAGKTTLAIALACDGWDFGGDDMVFLDRSPGELVVRTFPDEVDVTDQTAAMFPQLAPVLARPTDPEWPKRALRLEEYFPCASVLECRPAAVVFPAVVPEGATALAAMDAGDALVELLPNVLLTEALSAQAHVDALSELVQTVPCFRLDVSRDLLAAGRLLRDLLR